MLTREELKEHCQRQIQNFERVEKIMPVTPNDWKRYEEHKLILELLEQEPILDKIRDEIDTQDKWLAQAGYNAYNVDIAFNSIERVIAESEE